MKAWASLALLLLACAPDLGGPCAGGGVACLGRRGDGAVVDRGPVEEDLALAQDGLGEGGAGGELPDQGAPAGGTAADAARVDVDDGSGPPDGAPDRPASDAARVDVDDGSEAPDGAPDRPAGDAARVDVDDGSEPPDGAPDGSAPDAPLPPAMDAAPDAAPPPDRPPPAPWTAVVEAEGPTVAHETGHAEPGGWAGTSGLDPPGLLLHGGGVAVPPGPVTVELQLAGMDPGDPQGIVGRVEVFDEESAQNIVSEPLRNGAVAAGVLALPIASPGHRLQVRLRWLAATHLFVNRVVYREAR